MRRLNVGHDAPCTNRTCRETVGPFFYQKGDRKMNRELYYRGRKGMQWGIWDTAEAGWILNIAEDTPMLAEARLYQKLGKGAKNTRFQPRPLPQSGRKSGVQARGQEGTTDTTVS